MACYVPFNSRNLDISFFMFRPTMVYVDDLVDALKRFSTHTQSLGCVHSSIFTSIHGSMIIWYGAWMKMTDENKQILTSNLLSMLSNVTSMAMLMEHSFFDAYAGESRDGSPAAKFSTGDIVSMNSASLSTKEDIGCYAGLAIFKARFHKMDGARAGVCLRSQNMGRIVGLFVWKSLQLFYSYILTSDFRTAVLPFLDDIAFDIKYDVFRVVYVSGDSDVMDVECCYPRHSMLGNEKDNSEAF